jgi:hypothetical protein
MLVMDRQITTNGLFKLAGTAVAAALDALIGELGKPALHLVDPRCRSRCEVHVKARAAREPTRDRGRLVRAVVVEHQVHVERCRHVLVDGAQKLQELLGPVAAVQLADHPSAGDVEGGNERRGSVTGMVVRAPFGQPRGERQNRLRAVERLNLGLLVHTQHQGPVRRVEIQPHDVAHLVDEQRIGGELEGLPAVRLQSKRAPHAAHRALGQPEPARRRACAPVRGITRQRIEGRAMRRSIFASPIRRGAPGRGSSSRPSRRRSTKRLRHLPTVCGVT